MSRAETIRIILTEDGGTLRGWSVPPDTKIIEDCVAGHAGQGVDVLSTAEGDQDQCAYPLLPHRELTAAQPQVQATEAEGGWQLESSVYCRGVHFNDHARAVVTDNYLDLLPGVPVTLARVDGRRSLPKLSATAPEG